MAKAIMVQGTCSNAGKSLLVAGLCRVFKQDGYKVAPFKSQNMALNSYITGQGLEMGRAQVVQSQASGILPDVRMNPILLKPTSDQGSQVIVNGEVLGNMSAVDYYKMKPTLLTEVKKAYNSLAEEYDIIVIEGAGSPAEINLKENDIVNMGLAKAVDAPVLIVGDIDRGGVFASLAGTLMLLDDEEKALVKGTIINKFRGDVKILEPGLKMLEDIIKVPVVGVVPYINVDIDDEDSLSSKLNIKKASSVVDIAVVRLPRISNFTDFNALDCIDGVNIRYIGAVEEFKNPDMVIIPGTKNTMSDLKWMRESGIEAQIMKYHSNGGIVFGICGGFQMLGMELSDPYKIEHGGNMAGMGLLEHTTVFEKQKIRTATKGVLDKVGGIFAEISGEAYEGYEIHMGVSQREENIINNGNVYGSYIHGIFDEQNIAKIIVKSILAKKGLDFTSIETFDINKYRDLQYDILADAVRNSLDMEYIYGILR